MQPNQNSAALSVDRLFIMGRYGRILALAVSKVVEVAVGSTNDRPIIHIAVALE
jgi:hypothetical protein